MMEQPKSVTEQPEASPITIVLAEDHNVVRSGLRILVESQQLFRVIGEASDGIEAVRITKN